MYSFLADLIVAAHTAYVATVVGGLVLVLVGGWRGWGWVRNRTVRFVHLGMIAFVAFEALVGMTCPLTDWEQRLRELAGQPVDRAGFIGRWLHWLLFFQLPEGVLTVTYLLFTLFVAASFWLVPVRPRRG